MKSQFLQWATPTHNFASANFRHYIIMIVEARSGQLRVL
ncbi:hypothetical protein COO91_02965 [Nostoc flagelliforme CCNUN1]|uniref:Uncharacterized protein n=1 Tax=Nostoc flagelliforme CCNUN1 TaxID=2038116 RepID=A0A2K8SNZ5_9NOSO|nr:hypothetical protein COO91_02965 [Nostoc flagelliforme CCNUN1]